MLHILVSWLHTYKTLSNMFIPREICNSKNVSTLCVKVNYSSQMLAAAWLAAPLGHPASAKQHRRNTFQLFNKKFLYSLFLIPVCLFWRGGDLCE